MQHELRVEVLQTGNVVVDHVVWEHNLLPRSIKLLLIYVVGIYFAFIFLKNMMEMWNDGFKMLV